VASRTCCKLDLLYITFENRSKVRTGQLNLQNQPLRMPQLTSSQNQPLNGLGWVDEGMEELQAQVETELQEKHKDLLAML
jgi:hypothetical protein